jgi:hypothetical protein
MTDLPKSTTLVWATPSAIFAAIPVLGSDEPYIARFPRSVEGLAAALNVMIEKPERASRDISESHPKINATVPERKKRPGTDEQRARAAAVLKQMGLT